MVLSRQRSDNVIFQKLETTPPFSDFSVMLGTAPDLWARNPAKVGGWACCEKNRSSNSK